MTTINNSRLPRVQLVPNFVWSEKRLCLTRIRWERGTVGIANGGYSAKLSISLCFVPEDFWVGAFWRRAKDKSSTERFALWVCVLPFIPIRFKLLKSWGGIF